MHKLMHLWYKPNIHLLLYPLLPLSWLFALIVSIRRYLYQNNIFKNTRINVPVIIVGNLTVGGTGKTPMVIWLAKYLQSQGFQPGIVSRGVGSKLNHNVHQVTVNDLTLDVGDEAALMFQQTQDVPIVIGRNRVRAANYLLKNNSCDILISDDGLQHYALARDIEIVMVDGMQQFGNRQLLPAGPLREGLQRLNQVDFVIHNSGIGQYTMQMILQNLKKLTTGKEQPIQTFDNKTCHAVAAIGNPKRFFSSLKAAGFTLIEHTFPDHYHYHAADFQFADQLPIVMTEKDAVKCMQFADQRFWSVTVDVNVNESFIKHLNKKLTMLRSNHAKNFQDVIGCHDYE